MCNYKIYTCPLDGVASDPKELLASRLFSRQPKACPNQLSSETVCPCASITHRVPERQEWSGSGCPLCYGFVKRFGWLGKSQEDISMIEVTEMSEWIEKFKSLVTWKTEFRPKCFDQSIINFAIIRSAGLCDVNMEFDTLRRKRVRLDSQYVKGSAGLGGGTGISMVSDETQAHQEVKSLRINYAASCKEVADLHSSQAKLKSEVAQLMTTVSSLEESAKLSQTEEKRLKEELHISREQLGKENRRNVQLLRQHNNDQVRASKAEETCESLRTELDKLKTQIQDVEQLRIIIDAVNKIRRDDREATNRPQ